MAEWELEIGNLLDLKGRVIVYSRLDHDPTGKTGGIWDQVNKIWSLIGFESGYSHFIFNYAFSPYAIDQESPLFKKITKMGQLPVIDVYEGESSVFEIQLPQGMSVDDISIEMVGTGAPSQSDPAEFLRFPNYLRLTGRTSAFSSDLTGNDDRIFVGEHSLMETVETAISEAVDWYSKHYANQITHL